MQTRILVISGFLMLAISGCSNEQSDQNATNGSGEPPRVLNEQLKALDKAKYLEGDLNAAYEKRAEQIDREGR